MKDKLYTLLIGPWKSLASLKCRNMIIVFFFMFLFINRVLMLVSVVNMFLLHSWPEFDSHVL